MVAICQKLMLMMTTLMELEMNLGQTQEMVRGVQRGGMMWRMFREIAMEALVKFRELTMALLYILMNNLDNMQFLYPKTCQHSLESKLKCML